MLYRSPIVRARRLCEALEARPAAVPPSPLSAPQLRALRALAASARLTSQQMAALACSSWSNVVYVLDSLFRLGLVAFGKEGCLLTPFAPDRIALTPAGLLALETL